MLDLALEQLPQSTLDGEILARSDSAGASDDLADSRRECDVSFSFGYPISEPIRQALLCLEDRPGGRRSTRTAMSATGVG